MEHEINIKDTNTQKINSMEVTIFLLITFGMSIFFGVILYLNIYNNAYIIALFMMLVPATGVAFAKELKNKNKNPTHVLHYLLIGKNINYFDLIMDIFFTIPNLIFQSILFFGEEYGWREFLQPLLQKKFGKRIGVILLGTIWELWHIPFFPDINWNIKMLLLRFCYLIALSIFMGYIYMRSHNVWMCALVHFINNTISSYSSDNNPNIYLVFLALSFILSLFIFSKEYDKNQNCFNNEVNPPC